MRVFIPLICALLTLPVIVDGSGEWWQWVSVAGLVVLQVVSLIIEARRRSRRS